MDKHFSIFIPKTFAVITGASRGLGRSMALQFGAKFPDGSVLVLMSRNVENLESVKSEVTLSSPNIKVLVQQYDQGDVENVEFFKGVFSNILLENCFNVSDFDQYMIVHNCASLGDITKRSLEVSDFRSVRTYYDVNVTGMILLNTSFFQTFSDSSKPRIVINISSACACAPLAAFGLYCSGKIARDMYMRVLAEEEPSLRILTFAPGCADTEMSREVETLCLNSSMKTFRANGIMKHPDVPITILVKILEENEFENAAFIESEKVF
ncbi:sepiapterin reductase-like [Argopecten irradians]|uniref:sepiapterin reductase-like n=1 Tax=Argopecten irradians TaxID=31199 RepID=UPI0037244C00